MLSITSSSSLPNGLVEMSTIQLLKESSAMSNPPDDGLAIRNIAVATDFSPWSDRAMQHALLIARWYGATLHIIHTIRPSEFSFVPDLMVQLDELAERDYKDLMGRLHAVHSLDAIQHRVWNLYGEVSTFGDFVREQKVDLLVLGTRGRSGFSKLLLGSVAEQISHCVSCPVLTVGPSSRGAASQLALKNVLFATDLSPQSTVALPYVLAAAKAWRAAIDVLHVCSPDGSDCQPRMDAYCHQFDALAASEPRLSIRYHSVPGEPSSAVLDFAGENNEDLIVLGLDNHRSLYGGPPLSHAYEIVRQARCPVLSVRSAPACHVG
jgi:nucleotide-binding universal stress UspA family protein